MATLTVQNSTISGLVDPTYDAADVGGDEFPNDESTVFHVKNGGGGSITLTFDDTGSSAPTGAKAFNADVDVVVGAGEEAFIGPFAKRRFGSLVGVSYSGVSSVTVAAIRMVATF